MEDVGYGVVTLEWSGLRRDILSAITDQNSLEVLRRLICLASKSFHKQLRSVSCSFEWVDPQWLPRRYWDTRVEEIPLSIPKLREGTFFPCLLEPRAGRYSTCPE